MTFKGILVYGIKIYWSAVVIDDGTIYDGECAKPFIIY